MPGNQLVPYDPDYIPRYQVRKPTRLERFHDVMEALLVDGKGQDLGAVVKALAVALSLAFAVTALVYLCWAMQVGIVTGKAWSQNPAGPFAGLRAFAWWWFLETMQFWGPLAALAAVFVGALVWRPALALYVKFLRVRRRQREDAKAAEADHIWTYKAKVAEIARQEQAARAAADYAAAEAARAAAKAIAAEADAVRRRQLDFQRWRAETMAALNKEVRGYVARERISALAQALEESTEEPFKRVRAMLKKQKLAPRYGLLHHTEDLDVKRVIGRSYAWLPPEIPREYTAGLSIENF